MRAVLYYLDMDASDRPPRPCVTDADRGRADGQIGMMVACTDVGPYVVSTIFIAVDHNFSPVGDPLVFETVVFGPLVEVSRREHLAFARYSTWADAKAGHYAMVDEWSRDAAVKS